jgi:hypothetical protein
MPNAADLNFIDSKVLISEQPHVNLLLICKLI